MVQERRGYLSLSPQPLAFSLCRGRQHPGHVRNSLLAGHGNPPLALLVLQSLNLLRRKASFIGHVAEALDAELDVQALVTTSCLYGYQ